MGKGDKKTKRGKIFAGSYGKHRLKAKDIDKIKKEKGKDESDGKDKKTNEKEDK